MVFHFSPISVLISPLGCRVCRSIHRIVVAPLPGFADLLASMLPHTPLFDPLAGLVIQWNASSPISDKQTCRQATHPDLMTCPALLNIVHHLWTSPYLPPIDILLRGPGSPFCPWWCAFGATC